MASEATVKDDGLDEWTRRVSRSPSSGGLPGCLLVSTTLVVTLVIGAVCGVLLVETDRYAQLSSTARAMTLAVVAVPALGAGLVTFHALKKTFFVMWARRRE